LLAFNRQEISAPSDLGGTWLACAVAIIPNMVTSEMEKFQPYTKAPTALHRLCTDVRNFPPSVQTVDDVKAWKSGPADVGDMASYML